MASQTADVDPITIKPFSKTIQFLSIIDNEKVLKSAHKTKVWLLTFNFDEEQTDDDARFVKNWINNSFSNAIYCDPKKSSEVSLAEKIRMMLYVKNMAKYKAANAARKLANQYRTVQKAGADKAAKKRAAQKRRDKEAAQIAAMGHDKWNAKIQKDQSVARVKRAEKVKEDCSKVVEFTNWRCGTDAGKSYDRMMTAHHGTSITQSWTIPTKKKTLRLKASDAYKTFVWICQQKKKNIGVRIKTHDNVVHQYGIYRIPTGGIPYSKVEALHIEQGATRMPDSQMCGKVHNFFYSAENIIYININRREISLYRLLPKKWRDFGAYKTDILTAEPKKAATTRLMFGIVDDGCLALFSWTDGDTHYTAMSQSTGNKTFEDIKNIGLVHYTKAMDEAKHAERQQKEKRQREKDEKSEIYKAFFSTSDSINSALRTMMNPPPQPSSSTNSFCGGCGTKINPTTLSGGKAKFCSDCGTRFA